MKHKQYSVSPKKKMLNAHESDRTAAPSSTDTALQRLMRDTFRAAPAGALGSYPINHTPP